MKKLFYSFAILMALVGCSEDPATGGNENGGGEEPAPEAKEVITVALEAPEGIELVWSEGDAISVFRSNVNEKFAYSAEDEGFVKADNSNKGAKVPYMYGIYPYSSSSSVNAQGAVSVQISNEQNYQEGTFDFAHNPMIAVAEKGATELELKNLCGFICVKIFGNAGIKSVELKGNNGEYLAGTISVNAAPDSAPTCSFGSFGKSEIKLNLGEGVALGATAEEAKEFWFIVPPTTFSNGLSIAVVDEYDNILRKNYTEEVVVSRNAVTSLETMEIKAKVPAKAILDVQFNEDGTATDAAGIYDLNVELVGGSAVSVYKHSGYDANNIARFDNIRINNDRTDHSYYKIDYSANEEFKATIADGFTWEIVSLSTFSTYDWWLSPGGSDAFSFVFKDYCNNYAWNFVSNHGGGWFASGNATEATYEFNKYNHDLYIYDANNQVINIYHNGVLCGTRAEVVEFNPGNWMTIGGRYSAIDNGFYMQWNGEVAMYRVYDQALTEEEIAEKCNSLVLPEASEAPLAALSTPLLDVQWNADKTATNVGTQTDLEIAGYPNDNTVIVNVEGYGNVVDFNDAPENHWWEDGFYRIDYSANEEFKSKLQDGFSFEILCVADHNPGDYYVRPAAANTWGIHLRCTGGGGRHYWQIFKGGNNDVWQNLGDVVGTIGDKGTPIFDKEGSIKMEKFSHIVYTYNAEAKAIYVFIDGVSAGGWFGINDFNVGNVFGICGMPAKVDNDGVLRNQHRWPGKIATVRIYDEALSVGQVAKRYQDLQPTIEKLNPTIGQ